MNNIGVIAEYNPFHNGHLYHLEETKKLGQADHVIAVMSGDFTQRGEPALYDKWIRAEMAVKNGVDLVIELPFIFACNNAEYFAMGGIHILNGLGCVSYFSFGSETGELANLQRVAEILVDEGPELKEALKKYLDQGYSYPRARFEAVKEIEGEEAADLIREPNNILGVEYLKQWIRTGKLMTPIAVKRMGKGYHDRSVSHQLASATAIRQAIAGDQNLNRVKKALPEATAEIMERCGQNPATDYERFFPILVYKILTTPVESLAEILSVGEGLENKLKKAIIKSRNMEELIGSVLSKRYTETRIKRLLLHTLTSLTKREFFEMVAEMPLYARVLGFSSKGAKLLRHIKQTECASFPVISNINKEVPQDAPQWKILLYDILAADIYNLAYNNELYERSDYVCSPSLSDDFADT
ncbi:MAG TPA: nucleotidyltransferase [Bacillota bacterium]|nr:nucleotidyltransferase [Bacillota bacterium]